MRSRPPTGKLRDGVEAINDKRALEKLAEIEKSEGKKTRYHVEALMIEAKRVLRAQDATKPDIAEITQGDQRIRKPRQGGRRSFRRRRQGQDRLDVHQQRQVVSHHGEAADAPHPRQDAVQPGRQDDAQRRRRLDGRGLAGAADARLQQLVGAYNRGANI